MIFEIKINMWLVFGTSSVSEAFLEPAKGVLDAVNVVASGQYMLLTVLHAVDTPGVHRYKRR